MNENFNIPKNWKVETFEDISEGKNAIVDGPFGSNLKTSDYIDDKVNGVPVLTTKNLEGDYSDEKVRFISKDKFETLKRSQVNSGDILVAKIGSIGKTGIYPKNARTAIIPANLLKFTVSKKVNFNYVYYYLNSRGLQNRIKKISTATAQPAFNVTKFRKLRIPIPPLPEQQAIVSKIEELLSDLENGKQQLQIAQQQLKGYRQSLLKAAFEGKLTNKDVKEGELPKGWKWVKLKDIAKEISDGDHQAPPKAITGIPFITISNVNKSSNKIDFTDTFKVNKDYYQNLKANRRPQKGDILYTVTGSFGIPVLIDFEKEFCFQRHIGLVRPLDTISQKWVYYLLQSPTVFNQAKETATGTAQKTVALSSLRNFIIPYCPFEEQQLIVSELESKLTVCDKIEETISQSLQQMETLRQSILKKAFEGRLV
jgi:type I restriction enzyme S subunit